MVSFNNHATDTTENNMIKEKAQTRRGLIPEPVLQTVCDMYFIQNKHMDDILIYLQKEHGIKISNNSLYRKFAEEKAVRASLAHDIKKENIKHTATTILQKVDDNIEFLSNEFARIWTNLPKEEIGAKEALKLKELEIKLYEVRLKSIGMIDDGNKISDAIDKLNEKLGLS